ncbi:MAG: response regulator [bacterium]
MRVLVVDDDVRLLAETGRILTRNGHSVDCIDNAKAAVEITKRNCYDFVLVDYRMPEHDGIWFLRNAALPRRTKALLVTSLADGTVIRQMFGAGVSGYVLKPFDETELLCHLKFHSEDHKPA